MLSSQHFVVTVLVETNQQGLTDAQGRHAQVPSRAEHGVDGVPLILNVVTRLSLATMRLLAFFASTAASSRPSLAEAGTLAVGASPLASINLAALAQLFQPLR